MNLRLLKVAWLSLLFGAAARVWPAGAQEAGAPSEYQVKAAFLYNFAKFVEWPPQAFPATNTPITIGMLGRNPFDGELERAVRNKVVNGRPLVMQKLASTTDPLLKHCQIVFIQPMEKNRLVEFLAALKDAPVLTVSESEGFTRYGGMINFVMEERKVRFEINDAAAARAGLKISSKLLSLAKKSEGGQ
jgi:hypothetical protein